MIKRRLIYLPGLILMNDFYKMSEFTKAKVSNAIDDHSITVNVNATNSKTAPNGLTMIDGALAETQFQQQTAILLCSVNGK